MWRLAKPSFLWRFLIYRNFEEKVCRWCNGGWGASVFCDEVLICSTHGVVGGDGLLKVTFPWGGMSHVKEQQKSLRLPLGAEISFFWKKKNVVSPVGSILVNFPSVLGWGFQNVKSIHSLATAAASALQLFLIYDDIVLHRALLQLWYTSQLQLHSSSTKK